MLNPWLLLGSIAFVASFSISLLINRDLGSAIVAGSTALATAWGTAATVNWYRNHSTNTRLTTLKHQIRTLQYHRATEQQALLELEAEKERIAQSIDLMQGMGQYPTEMPPPKGVSWNLMATEVVESSMSSPPEQLTTLGSAKAAEDDLRQFLAEAAATKQKITTTLNNLQAELRQLDAQTSENRQFRDQLVQEINHLSQQKQALASNTKRLEAEVKDLEQCRTELEQYVSYVETKKQELETGNNPLQKALKQLQTQVTALQTELRKLETQVSDRLHEKESLDYEIAALEQQKAIAPTGDSSLEQTQMTTLQENLRQLETQISDRLREKDELDQAIASMTQQNQQAQVNLVALEKLDKQLKTRRQEKEALEKQITQLKTKRTALRASSVQPDLPTKPESMAPKPNSKKLVATPKPPPLDHDNGAEKSPQPATSNTPKSAPFQEPEDSFQKLNDDADDLSDSWTNFMVQLSDYEFQALRAIAQESNPLRTLNAIADEGFSSVDELLISINRQAQDVVGESVVNPRSGFAPPEIARQHQKTIKKMIETYDYLTE
ncbi:hypothetical protein JOY44_16765 [Phormidium sp. CLA17]|uniref:hypothetical protein n=1 Tax=Leptolyngbya sp. Cla-17 TaxID=2803751 RepID=UPI0014929EB4|nr:hypothetical protein [Leptolyngbya sp. Cla-17]MBM0743243.1 hypothetical protein [Leptolyngbya sp. Cla-17]